MVSERAGGESHSSWAISRYSDTMESPHVDRARDGDLRRDAQPLASLLELSLGQIFDKMTLPVVTTDASLRMTLLNCAVAMSGMWLVSSVKATRVERTFAYNMFSGRSLGFRLAYNSWPRTLRLESGVGVSLLKSHEEQFAMWLWRKCQGTYVMLLFSR